VAQQIWISLADPQAVAFQESLKLGADRRLVGSQSWRCHSQDYAAVSYRSERD
jgi:hypothetical protein